MSRVNGEKARAALAKRSRNAQRVKDRARLAEIRQGGVKAKTPAKKPGPVTSDR